MNLKKHFIYLFFVVAAFLCEFALSNEPQRKVPRIFKDVLISAKKIELKAFPKAFNPSIIKIDEGFLLVFRYIPDESRLWISKIGVVILNEFFEPLIEPQLLDTRQGNLVCSQSEDARVISIDGSIYLVFNDKDEVNVPEALDNRRDMFIAQLTYKNQKFTLSKPIMLYYEEEYWNRLCQKNWVPFDWQGKLLLGYTLNPHQILQANLDSGVCMPCHQTKGSIHWRWGEMRGGTPALLVDGEYLAFFHSGIFSSSAASWHKDMWHYYMGAYTFSSEPPFQITRVTPYPIISKSFYTKSRSKKRVIFPGGFVISDSEIYVAYGKDDSEIWIGVIDKNRLKTLLKPVKFK